MNDDAIFDLAAFEAFRDGLIAADFSPVPGTEQLTWSGPLRTSLRSLSDQKRMSIRFPDGWPLRYAKTQVDGLITPHSAEGTPCLWADDDPAQIAGADIDAYFSRLDEWARRAATGFELDDLALDGFLHFEELDERRRSIELPVGDLIRHASNGQIDALTGRWEGEVLRASTDSTGPLDGVMYFSRRISEAPRTYGDLLEGLTHHQREDIGRRLMNQRDRPLREATGRPGADFLVVTWPTPIGTDAVAAILTQEGDELTVRSLRPAPSDSAARRMRAGPDADDLEGKRVLVVGAGSIGGYAAVALAESGIGQIEVADNDVLLSANLVRHVAPSSKIGAFKANAVAAVATDHAPWAEVTAAVALPLRRSEMEGRIDGFDLVVDCTGNFAITAALIETCYQALIPLVTGALFNQGTVLRIRRQANGDTPIAARASEPRYPTIPAASGAALESRGFLEVGCAAPVNAAAPWAAMRAAADVVEYAVDALTRKALPDERMAFLAPRQATKA